MYDQLLQAMFRLQEVRRPGDEPIDESDVSLLREAVRLINEVILTQGETLDGSQSADVAISEENEILVADTVAHALARNREVALRAKMYEDELRDNLLENMEEYDIEKFDCDVFSAKRVPAGVSNRFGTAAFKKEYPELYEEFVTQSERKSYVRITYND